MILLKVKYILSLSRNFSETFFTASECKRGKAWFIPITLEDARALAVLTHPNHLLTVSSWGFARLPPSCISNSDGYSYE